MLFLGILLFIIVIFIQPQEFLAPFKGMPLVSYVMGAVSIGWFIHSGMDKNKASFFKSQQNILMLLFWIIIGISTVQVAWLTYTLNTFIEWGKVVLIYFLMSRIINSEKRLVTTLWVIVLCASFLAISGILLKNGIDVTGVGIGNKGRIRGIGIFGTNQLAYTLVFLTPLSFALFFITKNGGVKLFLISNFFLTYYAVYLTGSRGGLLAAVLGLGMMFIVFAKKNSTKIVGIVIALLLLLVFWNISDRLDTVSNYQEDSSARGRISVWGESLGLLKSYPIFGVGKGQFREYLPIAPHSSYIQVVMELGLTGLFVWLALFYYSIKNLKKIEGSLLNQEQRKLLVISKALQVCFLIYLFGSFFSGNGYYITLYMLFSLNLVMQHIVAGDVLNKRQIFKFQDIRNIAFIECCIILLIYIIS